MSYRFLKENAKVQKKFHVVKFFQNKTMMKTHGLLILVILIYLMDGLSAQVKLGQDTLQCHIIGFSAGVLTPGAGSGGAGGSMRDLYKPPYLDFALECDYKYQTNWLVTLDADLWFGLTSNNLNNPIERMNDVFSESGIARGWGGTDGGVMLYNRGLSARLGVAKVLPVIPKNPNSGVLLKLSGGWFMQKTAVWQDRSSDKVPQLSGDYFKLRDHLRNGVLLTESVGFWYMNNRYTYVNFKVTFDISECFSWSSRPYIIDDLMGLNGKDNNRYFDLLYGVKLTWMFPLTGKTTFDYYYY